MQCLNDVLFGSMNAVQCMNNPKYHNFRLEDPFKMDYSLVQSLMNAWKIPIRVTPVSTSAMKVYKWHFMSFLFS